MTKPEDLNPEDLAALDLGEIDAELDRRKWRGDPVGWIQGRLKEFVWSKQREIAEALRDHRRVAVQSCHSGGKSWLMARLASWWLDTASHVGEAFVVTSAPSFHQVRAILWREIGRAHARGRLKGRTNQTEWWMPVGETEEMVAFGRKPADMDPTGFQGIHARRVLLIFDEACGIPPELWEAGDSLLANEESKMIAIGNPDDPTSHFAKVCKPGSGWHVIRINAFDTPNFTGEAIPDALKAQLISKVWVEEKRRSWGEDNPLWIAKVLGEFPENADDGLIPIAWVRAAQERTLDKTGPIELGVDVGGGGDKSVRGCRWGSVFRILDKNRNPNTMEQLGYVLRDLKAVKATRAKIDKIGIGKGMCDRAEELEREGKLEPGLIEGINVGEAAANKEEFANLKSELSWAVRERFQAGEIDLDPADEDLAAQCCGVKYFVTSRGQIAIESKDDYKKRLKTHSPDEWDALVLAFAPGKFVPSGMPVGGDQDEDYDEDDGPQEEPEMRSAFSLPG